MASAHHRQFSQSLLISSPFWQAKLEQLSHPSAIRMAEALEPTEPLGIGLGDNAFWKGFKHSYGEKDSNIDYLLRVKTQHPEKIALVQIGEFYETWGIDSVFMVEYCGLNRMGKRGPRAGLPLANIQTVLNKLTAANFAVVVCEQAEDVTKNGRKTRFIAEVITPSSPVYTYGLAMDKHRGETFFPDCPPEFGFAMNKSGITVVEVNPDLRTVFTLDALTPEAAFMRLSRYAGRLSRIFYHENFDKDFFDVSYLHHVNLINVSGYLPQDFPRRIEELIKIDLALRTDTPFIRITPAGTATEISPRPLYLGTAQQIGLLSERGVPSLIEHMLPKGSPVTCQNLLRHFLLNPPPQSVANHLRQTLQRLISTELACVTTFPVSNPARYIKVLQKHEANPDILQDLFQITEAYLGCYDSPLAPAIAQALQVVSHRLNMCLSEQVLRESSVFILERLRPILPHEDDQARQPKHTQISKHLFEGIDEAFRGRVAKTSNKDILQHYNIVAKAALRYEKALTDDLIPWVERRIKERLDNKKLKPFALSYDIHNKAIWMRGPVNKAEPGYQKLCHPMDRYGKEVSDRWTTHKVEKYLREYKAAAEQARLSIVALLTDIAKALLPHSLSIVHLATFSNLLRTLMLHVKECQTKQWNLAYRQHSHASNRLEMSECFPYWMLPHAAVKNSLTLQNVALLTGHNMAGKSTTLRTSAVVTLLASAGFMFPAQQVCVSEPIDGWFVRTGASDDPEAGLSAFAVEMHDIKIALRDASENSFILIDELGKGTESKAGHAIAGSVLEYLHQHNIRAIFSTHWHELFFNSAIELDSIQKICMENQQGKATYKVVPGRCTSSFAFETALQLGIEASLIHRAKTIAKHYELNNSYQTTSSPAPLFVAENTGGYITHTLTRAGKVLCEVTGLAEANMIYLSSEVYPLLKDSNSSAVYILKTAAGFYYTGETDNIHARIESHRQSETKKACEVIYALIAEGKSMARKYETQVTLKLQSLGFPMLSVNDAKHRHFGSA